MKTNKTTLIAALAVSALALTKVDAQVYTGFTNTIVNKPFVDLPASKTLMARSSFVDAQTPSVQDPDNGYYRINGQFGIPLNDFYFVFDGTPRSVVNVNVNGFVMFDNPIRQGTDLPNNLFGNSGPTSVVAPYWGDHYYRSGVSADAGYVPSSVSYLIEGTAPNRVLTIEWKNLNINYRFNPLDPNAANDPLATPQRTSVGSFQVKLYESLPLNQIKPANALNGNIEFYYSTVGDPSVPGVIKTSGASVGLKSAVTGAGAGITFMNGLFIEDSTSIAYVRTIDNKDSVRGSFRLTSTWAPSRANNNVVSFVSTPKPALPGWGDGDANLTQLTRTDLKQNRFVTMADVITVMRSVAKVQPLDSILGRSAYHADVNHDGRFYYRQVGSTLQRVQISTRVYGIDTLANNVLRENVEQSVPNDANRVTQMYFQANEDDAALILSYIGGRIPALPWIININHLGKVSSSNQAPSLEIGAPINVNGSVKYPLYVKNHISGPFSAKIELNSDIQSEAATLNNADVVVESNNNILVLALNGVVNSDDAVAYITLPSNNIEVNNARVNGSAASVKVASATKTSLVAYPNPANNELTLILPISTEGSYSVKAYDVFGNVVAVLFNGKLSADNNTISTNVKSLSNGTYMFRVEGENSNIVGKFTVLR